jgi:cell wall-associated NlpC family hydrolase
MMNRTRLLSVIATLIAAASSGFASETSSVTGLPPESSAATPASPDPARSASTSPHSRYTTVKGDTVGSVARQFACSSASLRKLNHLKGSHLRVGTVLEIPAVRTASLRHGAKASLAASKKPVVLTARQQHQLALEAALRATDKYRLHAPVAQPVQDFDIPPSTFASCPPPPSGGQDTDFAASREEEVTESAPPAAAGPGTDYPAPLAMQNSHSSLLPVPASLPEPSAPSRVTSSEAETAAPTSFAANRSGSASTALPSVAARTNTPPVLAPPSPPKKSFASALADFFGGGSRGLSASEAGEWGNRFLLETRNLAAQGVCYDGSWRPDGESHRWEMDCSNTTRYLYQVTAGIQLPRTASDQYYYLHLQDKAWDVPMTSAGFADCNFLRNNLKPGDLLFWENTYRPERQPPITHVMIFLGSDARGRWLMAGSQGSRGFYNRRHSGPDVYVFDPTHAVGGYTTWLGLVRHHGRFVAYGRPLEADVKKLSVAAND